VVSIGDLLLIGGLAGLLVTIMVPGPAKGGDPLNSHYPK